MSQENVEVCKRLFEAVAIRDTEASLQYIDPKTELHSAIIGGAEGNVYHGHEGFRQRMAESDAAFEELRPLGAQVVRAEGFLTHAEALEAAGLRE